MAKPMPVNAAEIDAFKRVFQFQARRKERRQLFNRPRPVRKGLSPMRSSLRIRSKRFGVLEEILGGLFVIARLTAPG